MKKIIVILALVMTAFSYAQTDNIGSYKVTFDGRITHHTNSCSSYMVEVVFYDGQKTEFLFSSYTNKDGDIVDYTGDKKYIQTYTKRIDKVIFTGLYGKHDKDGDCEQDHDGGKRIEWISGRCKSFYAKTNGSVSLNQYATITIEPNIVIQDPPPGKYEYSLPTDHKVVIEATGGFDDNSGVYNWQYSFEKTNPQSGDWITIDPTYDGKYNGKYVLGADENGVTASELFPNNVQNLIGQEILLRVKYCDDKGTVPVLYKIIPSAPNYTGAVSSNPKCIGGDGNATLYFDRQLRPNERITILTVKDSNFDLLKNSYTDIEKFNESDGKFTYTLTEASGTYKVGVILKYGILSEDVSYTGGKDHEIIFNIKNPTPVVFNLISAEDVTDLSCANAKDGTITISASGGTGEKYQYQIRKKNDPWGIVWNDFTTANESKISELLAATYQIQIRDGNGCIASEIVVINGKDAIGDPIMQDVTIIAPTAIDAGVTDLKQPTANGSSDGSITAIIKGGTSHDNGTYTFKWVNKNNPAQIFTTIETKVSAGNQEYMVRLHSIPAGTYALEVSDKSNCSTRIDNIILDQPEILEVILEMKQISCPGGSDGEIVAYAKGGVAYSPNVDTNFLLYYYSWKKLENGVWIDVPQQENTNTINSLKAGNYAVYVTDKNGVVVMDTIEVVQPEVLTLEFETTMPLCYDGADGSATVTTTGGTKGPEGYTYEWKNSDGIPISSEVTVTGLSAGNYTITVTDANECTIEDMVDIKQPEALSVTFETTRATCGGADGSATAQVNGGTEGYTYVWNTGATTQKIEGLKADTYTVTITDANDCKITDTIVIQEPDPITIERIKTSRTNCGGAIGTAEVIMSGNTAPYVYLWSTGATTQKIEKLPYGEYTVTVKDKNNCSVEGSVTIQEPDPIIVQGFETTSGTCDEPNGAAKVLMSGATGPYTYEWSTGATTQEITGVRAGKYFVIVTDANYCTTKGKVVIEEISGIEIDVVSHVDPLCATSKDGSITIVAKGGAEPYTYMWTRKETSDVIATTADINGLSSGTYVVEVNDAIGCTIVYEETLIAPEVVEVVLGSDLSICRGQSVTLDITIDDLNATYSWVSDTGYSNSLPTVELIDSGTYIATVTTGKGCIGTDEIIITVSDNPIDADFLYSTYLYADQQIEVINVSSPIGERVEWTVSEEVTIVEESKEKIILSFEESDIPKTYYTTLTSYNKNEECSVSLTKPIIIEPGQGFSRTNGSEKFIEEFLIFPNANKGDFSIKVSLGEPSDVSVKIMNLMSAIMDKQEAKGADSYELEYNLSITPGIYLVVLETSHGVETRKLVVE